MEDRLTLIRRDDATIPVVFDEEDGTFDANGDPNMVPLDITGYTLFFTVKLKPTDSDTKAKIKAQNSTHDNAANGETHITLTAALTDIPEGVYWYDFQVKDGANLIASTPATRLVVTQDITERTS
jgi:hypothetical protein